VAESQPTVAWRRSSRCDAGSCVEVAHIDGAFAVRDSKDRSGPTLLFTRAEWSAFVAGVRAGDFEF
jgi:Domain of unknown function (DUF397)